ncbi:phosphomevalonate kinase [Cryptotrichosporon argae]
MTRTVVSAPGKVLLAGGYLVLDRAYTGLVVAASSRFYCSVADGASTASSRTAPTITVRAGQFPLDQSTWAYALSLEGDAVRLEQTQETVDKAGRNKFVEITVAKALLLAVETHGAERLYRRLTEAGGLDVVVLADNDFYSQREQLAAASLPLIISSLKSLAPFHPLPRPIGGTNKTGLGSSAALVTSLTAGLLAHLSLLPSSMSSAPSATPTTSLAAFSRPELERIHNLAQIAHCSAQGKVGSGFDVASAVFGTHLYRRFSPSLIDGLLEAPTELRAAERALTAALKPHRWDQGAEAFRLPRGMRLMLADVDAGTDTPSFVGKVLGWRKAEAKNALDLWTRLDAANMALGRALAQLVALEDEAGYDEALQAAAQDVISETASTPVGAALGRTRGSLLSIRYLLRAMSAASSVPIEPPEQTRLLDACSALPGVISGGVPGAGGYDALFLLVIDAPAVEAAVESVWAGWTEMSVCPLSARQSDGGLQRETVEHVRGLQKALARAA